MGRDVSPPPLKRRKTVNGEESTSPSRGLEGELNASDTGEIHSETIRIYAWNINGISPFLQKSITSFFSSKASSNSASTKQSQQAPSLRAFLRRHYWPQILCLQEVKIAHSDKPTQNAVKRAVNDSPDGPRYEVFFTLPTDKFNARGWAGKVYGVCTIIRAEFHKNHVERVREVHWDKEGRISIIQLRSETNLEIWNVYAVNGTDSEWRDPKSGEVIGTRHDKKLLMHNQIVEDCKTAQESGRCVVIVGDLNVAPTRIDGHPNLRIFPEQHCLNRADFNAKFFKDPDGLQAVDVWRELKGDEKRYTYYSRGRPWGSSCDRVDLVIASKRLVDAGDVVDMEIFNIEEERGPSDHVPIAVEIRLLAA